MDRAEMDPWNAGRGGRGRRQGDRDHRWETKAALPRDTTNLSILHPPRASMKIGEDQGRARIERSLAGV